MGEGGTLSSVSEELILESIVDSFHQGGGRALFDFREKRTYTCQGGR